MTSKIIYSIVPKLPPAINGLGDYGLALARELRANFSLETRFIVCDPAWEGPDEIEKFKVIKLAKRSSGALLELLPVKGTIFLHYVGYGYAKRGCPLWLAHALDNWRANGQNRKLVTMFHELFAFGPIWTSQFWLSPVQRYIAWKLINISDEAITNKNTYAQIIRKYRRDIFSRIPVIPVFSNIGELENPIKLKDRKKKIVVFGGLGPRQRVYEESLDELLKTAKALQVSEILDIGPHLPNLPEKVGDVPIRAVGILTHQEISTIFSDSLVGFFNYPTEYLSKSGIFAAYCAHGLLPVGTWYDGQLIEGVVCNQHYVLGNSFNFSEDLIEEQNIAERAHAWYFDHSLKKQSELFYKYFKDVNYE